MASRQLGKVLFSSSQAKALFQENSFSSVYFLNRGFSDKALQKGGDYDNRLAHPTDVPKFIKSGPLGDAMPTSSGLSATAHALTYVNPKISYDDSNHMRYHPGDPQKRAFTYFVMLSSRVMWFTIIRSAIITGLIYCTPSKASLAVKNMELDIGSIEQGQQVTVKFRGKPVFVRHRTDQETAEVRAVPMSDLIDPQDDRERVTKDKDNWLIINGICTHLGCIPIAGAGNYGGYFCPCHGSHYDASGRVRKGPAPTNMTIVSHKFLPDNILFLGDTDEI